jgi:RNA polymerase sigma-70 factor (ECF subfamily)
VTDLQDRRDRDLLARIASGSEEAFSELFRRYAPAAGGIALRVVGDAAIAEEVVQEVMVSVWRRAGAYDPARGSVRSWLLAQAHHRAVDAVRREEANRRRASATAPESGDDPIDDVVEEGWLASRRTRVRAALASLSSDQRNVLELAYYGGLTQSQVAEAAGIPLGTVKSRTLAAMSKLRSVLGASLEVESS